MSKHPAILNPWPTGADAEFQARRTQQEAEAYRDLREVKTEYTCLLPTMKVRRTRPTRLGRIVKALLLLAYCVGLIWLAQFCVFRYFDGLPAVKGEVSAGLEGRP